MFSVRIKQTGHATIEFNCQGPTSVSDILSGARFTLPANHSVNIRGQKVSTSTMVSEETDIWILKESSNA